jgi:hypothetical protein
VATALGPITAMQGIFTEYAVRWRWNRCHCGYICIALPSGNAMTKLRHCESIERAYVSIRNDARVATPIGQFCVLLRADPPSSTRDTRMY